MSIKDYKMGWQETVSVNRWHQFRAGILTVWEINLLFQDMLEAHVVPAAELEHAMYLIQMGHCHVDGRGLQ